MLKGSSIGLKLSGLLLVVIMIIGGLTVLGNASATEAEEKETIEPEFPEIQITEETIFGVLEEHVATFLSFKMETEIIEGFR